MWWKYLLLIIVGIIENYIYTLRLLTTAQGLIIKSSTILVVHTIIYLSVVAWAIKDTNTLIMIIIYAFGCGIGNGLALFWEKRKKLNEKTYKKLFKVD